MHVKIMEVPQVKVDLLMELLYNWTEENQKKWRNVKYKKTLYSQTFYISHFLHSSHFISFCIPHIKKTSLFFLLSFLIWKWRITSNFIIIYSWDESCWFVQDSQLLQKWIWKMRPKWKKFKIGKRKWKHHPNIRIKKPIRPTLRLW